MKSHFIGVDALVEQLDNVDAGHLYGDEEVEVVGTDDVIHGKNAVWARTSNYLVAVPVENIELTVGNIWHLPRAKAWQELIEAGVPIEPPAGRLYRIRAKDVKETQKWAKNEELEEKTNMVEPWIKADMGTFYVSLLDGNHRALAAIAAGEREIPVVINPNYRSDVRRKEWL